MITFVQKRLVPHPVTDIGDAPRTVDKLIALFFSLEHLDGDSIYECKDCFDLEDSRKTVRVCFV